MNLDNEVQATLGWDGDMQMDTQTDMWVTRRKDRASLLRIREGQGLWMPPSG